MPTRRNFLATLGVAALGIASRDALADGVLLAPKRKLKKVGLQLYTVRDLMKADLPGTLRRVAQIGYKEVEFAGYFGRSPAQIRALLKQNGLTSPSSHIGLDILEKDPVKAFADAKAIGHQWATVPWIPEERRKTVDDWNRIIDLLNKLGPQAKAAGLRLAYHNHDFEIRPVNGVRPLDMMLDKTDPSLVDFEMDLYWVVFGGGDPIDFPTIFAQSDKAGIKHYFVEHDQPADPIATIRNSYQYLHALRY